MCWQCETREDDIAEHLDEIRDAVREHGWVIKCVDQGKRPYAYTAGLHQFGLPELIATGVTTERGLPCCAISSRRRCPKGRSAGLDRHVGLLALGICVRR
jgi:Domain of unknown function (DUF4262)